MSTIPTIQVGTGNQTKVITPALLTAIGPDGQPVALKADANGQILTSGGGGGGGGGETPAYNIGAVVGTIQPNLSNGSRQYCYLTGDTLLQPPSGTAAEMDKFEFMIQWASGAVLLDISPSIKFSVDVTGFLPITLEAWRSYLITLRYQGGTWCFISIDGPYMEFVD